MKRWMMLSTMVLALSGSALAQKPESVREPDETIPLWAGESRGGKPPGEWQATGAEVREENPHMGGIVALKNVGEASLAYFRPAAAGRDQAVVICPGGAYHLLAWDLEGTEVAAWLSGQGVHAFVLKYRLPRAGDADRHVAALEDAQRAVSLVRHGAAGRGIASDRIGIMGFSAGGHLAALTADRGAGRSYEAADEIDAASCRPDFAALVYPAYLLADQNAPGNAGVRDAEGGATGMSALFRVAAGSPPVFMVHAVDDPVPVANCTAYLLALKSRGIPAELHVYPDGGHGYGLRSKLSVRTWPDRMSEWLGRVPRAATAGAPPASKDGQ
jgi:acetyl esterase/lipase